MTEKEIRSKLLDLDLQLRGYQKEYEELSKSNSIFTKAKLRKIKRQIEELTHTSIYHHKESLSKKREICEELLSQLEDKSIATNADGKVIELTDEVKQSFADQLVEFHDSVYLRKELYSTELCNSTITDELLFDGEAICLRITSFDYDIAAKAHIRLYSLDEMLYRYSLNYEADKKEKCLTNKQQ